MSLRFASFVLAFALAGAGASSARADDAKKTPDQIKQEKKEKDLKKAHEDLDKELKSRKIDPAPADGLLDKLALQVGLDVDPSKKLVHKVLDKKIPWDQVNMNVDDKLRSAVDPKTNKIDFKKFQADFEKWISTWKPDAAPAPKK